MKAAFCSLGCKVNQYESDCYAKIFRDKGYEIGSFDEICDVYVVNTCSVTNIGDRKSRKMLRRAKKLNPKAIVVATGCYAQTKAEEVKNMCEVDVVIGTAYRHMIADLAEAALSGESIDKICDISKEKVYEELESAGEIERTRAYIKIQDGCENYCSYCIIPYARGPVRSRKIENIINEAKNLSEKGFCEVVLTGISVASYGKDLKNGHTLLTVINEISKIDKISRIRLSSIDPRAFTDEFIKALSQNEKVCRHFHISLQSGSESVLKRMNRKYTPSEYMDVINKIRLFMPNCSITTDIICGFPEESEEEFNETIEFVKNAHFLKVHVFPYSERSGTVAAKMPQLPVLLREERAKKLSLIESEEGEKFERSFIGKEVKVLFEQTDSIYSEGLSENYLRIYVKADNTLTGTVRTVKIIDRKMGKLIGGLL